MKQHYRLTIWSLFFLITSSGSAFAQRKTITPIDSLITVGYATGSLKTISGSVEKITETQMTEEPGTLEETETGTATETQQEPVIQTVKITATGDCTLGATQTHGYAGSFHEYYDKYGQDYFFKNIRSIFEQDDFTLINLECVLSNATERVKKRGT